MKVEKIDGVTECSMYNPVRHEVLYRWDYQGRSRHDKFELPGDQAAWLTQKRLEHISKLKGVTSKSDDTVDDSCAKSLDRRKSQK